MDHIFIHKNTLVPPIDHRNLDYFLLSCKDQLKNSHNSPNLHRFQVLKQTTYPQKLGHNRATYKEISRSSMLLFKRFAKVTTSKPTHTRFKLTLISTLAMILTHNWKCSESLSRMRGGVETSIYVAWSSLFMTVNNHIGESIRIISVSPHPKWQFNEEQSSSSGSRVCNEPLFTWNLSAQFLL